MCGVCCCYVAPAPPMTPRCPAEPAAAAHSCGQLRGKSAAAPRTAPALTSPLHNRDVPWPQPPHGQIWSRHRHRGPAEWQWNIFMGFCKHNTGDKLSTVPGPPGVWCSGRQLGILFLLRKSKSLWLREPLHQPRRSRPSQSQYFTLPQHGSLH